MAERDYKKNEMTEEKGNRDERGNSREKKLLGSFFQVTDNPDNHKAID